MPNLDFSGSHAISEGLSKLGRGMTSLGRDLYVEQTRREEADRAVSAAKWKAGGLKALDKALIDYENTPYETRDQFRGLDEALDRLRESMGAVPDDRLRGVLEREFYNLDAAAAAKRDAITERKRADWGKAGLDEAEKAMLQIYASETDPTKRDRALADHMNAVSLAASGGIIGETDRNNRIVRAEENRLTLDAQRMIDEGKFDDAARFVEENKISLGAKYGGLKGMVEKEQKEKVRGAAYAKLFEEHNGDFTAMAKTLESPKKIEEMGISLEDAEYIRGFVQRSSAEQEKQRKVRHDETAKEVFLNFNKMTPGKIDELVRADALSYQLGAHFKGEMKRAEDERTDPIAYHRLFNLANDITDPESAAKARETIIRTPGVKFEDKKSLLLMTERVSDNEESAWLIKANNFLKDVVMPSQTMVEAAKPLEALRYRQAMIALKEAIDAAKQGGKPLTGKQILEKAMEIAPGYKVGFREAVDSMRDELNKGKAPPAAPKKNLKWNAEKGDFE